MANCSSTSSPLGTSARATVITSNLAFSEWNRVFGDDKLTAALLDRLAQHADVLVTRGPGDRGANAHQTHRAGQELAPFPRENLRRIRRGWVIS